MNLLFVENFNTLIFRAKNVYDAKDLRFSNRRNKKYVVTLKNGKNIHFGDSRYEDFLLCTKIQKDIYDIVKEPPR